MLLVDALLLHLGFANAVEVPFFVGEDFGGGVLHDALGSACTDHRLSKVVQGVAAERLPSSVLRLFWQRLTRLALIVRDLPLRRRSFFLLYRSSLVLGLFDLGLVWGSSGYRLLFPLVDCRALLALAHILNLPIDHVHMRADSELAIMVRVLMRWLLHLSIVVHQVIVCRW